MKSINWKRKTNFEKRFDELLEVELDSVEDLEDLSDILSLMERRHVIKRRVSPDTILVVAGNLLGIVLILTYERGNVIATKALGLIIRGRV